MTDLATINPDQLGEAVALAAGAQFLVSTPAGPLQRLPRASLIDSSAGLASDSNDSLPSTAAVRLFVAAQLLGIIDTDATLAANSDAKVPSQKALRTYIAAQIAALVNSAPGTLDTLGEIAAALAADEGVLAALTSTVAGKLAKAANLSDVTSPVAAIDNISIKGADIASAAITNLAAATGDFVNVTGVTPITGLGNAAAGVERVVCFTGALTLTHNAVSLILPTGANINTAPGDVFRFRSLGGGNWRCVGYQLATGAALTGGGGGGGSGNAWYLQWSPMHNEPPAANFASLDSRNGHPCLDFDTATQETAIFSGILPPDYSGAGVTVELWCSATTAVAGTVGWDVAFERMDASSLDTDADSFGPATAIAPVAVPGTSGQFLKMTVNVSNGANMDNLVAGEMFRLRIRRDVANDTAAGDAELLRVALKSQ